MTEEEALARRDELLQRYIDEAEAIIKKAQEDGTWIDGLDTNRELFIDIRAKYMKEWNELCEECRRSLGKKQNEPADRESVATPDENKKPNSSAE